MAGKREKTGEIHLADLLESLKKLPWRDESHASIIVESLGFSLTTIRKEAKPKKVFDANRYSGSAHRPLAAPSTRKTIPVPPLSELPVALPSQILDSSLTGPSELETFSTDEETFAWLDDPPVLYEADPIGEASAAAQQRIALFPDRVSRGVLTAALVTKRRSGEIDLTRLITDLLAGRALKTLPEKQSATLGNGCQLLLDYSGNMVPYWEDLDALARQAEAVVGKSVTEIFEFDTNPLQAITLTDRNQEDSWTPRADRPVMIATDLGIKGRTRPNVVSSTWCEFIGKCKAAGTPLLMLLPWSVEHWPENMGDYPTLIHWNTRTTATTIKHKISLGHEVSS